MQSPGQPAVNVTATQGAKVMPWNKSVVVVAIHHAVSGIKTPLVCRRLDILFLMRPPEPWPLAIFVHPVLWRGMLLHLWSSRCQIVVMIKTILLVWMCIADKFLTFVPYIPYFVLHAISTWRVAWYWITTFHRIRYYWIQHYLQQWKYIGRWTLGILLGSVFVVCLRWKARDSIV